MKLFLICIFLFQSHIITSLKPKYNIKSTKESFISKLQVNFILSTSATLFVLNSSIYPVNAAETIENTDTSINNLYSLRKLLSDEYIIDVKTQRIGIKLGESRYKGDCRVFVKDILEEKRNVIIGSILVGINDDNVEGLNLQNIGQIVSNTPQRPLKLTFRDPTKFFNLLDSSNSSNNNIKVVETSVKPAIVNKEVIIPEEILKVEIVQRGKTTKKAIGGDVVEVLYSIRDAKTNELLAGINDIDSSIASLKSNLASELGTYFILGATPVNKLPSGWDIALQGMCVGERRRITLPYSLALSKKSLPSWGTKLSSVCSIITDVELVSINGDAES